MLINKINLVSQLKAPYLSTFSIEGIDGDFCVKNLSIAELLDVSKLEEELNDGAKMASLFFSKFNALICDEEGKPLFDDEAAFAEVMPLWLAQKAVEAALTRLQIGPDAVEEAKKN